MSNPPINGRSGTGDVVAGVATAVLGLAVAIAASGFPEMPGGYPGPGLFPTLLGGLAACFGVALAVRGVLRGRRPEGGSEAEPAEPLDRRGVLGLLAVVAAAGGYLLLAELVGFLLAMGLVTVGLMRLFGVRLLRAVPVAVVLVLTIWYVFGTVLRVPLPAGPWGW